MGISSVRHVGRLERKLTLAESVPLTQTAIEGLVNPPPSYEPPVGLARRIEAQGTIVDGWNTISAYGERITVKRILGLVPSWI